MDVLRDREAGNNIVSWGHSELLGVVGCPAVNLMPGAIEFIIGHILHLDGGLSAKMAIDRKAPEGSHRKARTYEQKRVSDKEKK